MLGVDMWRLAETDSSAALAAAAARESGAPGAGMADAVSSGALQPGTPAYEGVVDRLMAYGGDYHPDWGLIPRAMAFLFRRLQASGAGGSGVFGPGGIGERSSGLMQGAAGAAGAGAAGGSAGREGATHSQHSSPGGFHGGGRQSRRTSLAGGAAGQGQGGAAPFSRRLPEGVKVTVTYLEIYNEKVYDLLCPDETPLMPAPGPRGAAGAGQRVGPASLDIVADPLRGVCVPDAVAVPVTNEAEVLALLWEGARNRVLASTDMNEHSSRSHTIWQVGIERTHRRSPGGSPMRHGSPSRGSSKTGRGSGAGAGSDDEDDEGGSGLVPGSTLGDAETVVSRSKVSLVDLVRPVLPGLFYPRSADHSQPPLPRGLPPPPPPSVSLSCPVLSCPSPVCAFPPPLLASCARSDALLKSAGWFRKDSTPRARHAERPASHGADSH